ncbi:N-acetylglucosaminyltransferase [Entophlyctis sp. JEL0112]|nr:N-acetylglucosaminyltransferase [Entophlyctis sp. JEL0112]
MSIPSVAALPPNIQLNILRLLSQSEFNKSQSISPSVVETNDEGRRYQDFTEVLHWRGYATIDTFLPLDLATDVRRSVCTQEGLRAGRVGTGALRTVDGDARSDKVRFIALSKNGKPDKQTALLQKVLECAESVISDVNEQLGLRENDLLRSNGVFQLAYYSNGARYRKHKDSSMFMPGRLLTLILYFSEDDWDASKGGVLRLYPYDSNETNFRHHVDIPPTFNKLLMFKSHMEHKLYSESSRAVNTICGEPPISVQYSLKSKATIFVSIASYRDPDTYRTIASLLRTASDPSAIHIAVFHQDHPDEDKSLHDQHRWSEVTSKYAANILRVVIPNDSAKGPYSARRIIWKYMLWPQSATVANAYYLQIDSHMRFCNEWDQKLLSLLKEAQSVHEKSVISFYPPGFDDNNLQSSKGGVEYFDRPLHPYGPVVMSVIEPATADPSRIDLPRVKGTLVFPAPSPIVWPNGIAEPPGLVRQRALAAGMLFAPVEAVPDMYALRIPAKDNGDKPRLKADAQLPGLFFGEEIACMARLWTWGWEVWGPRDCMMDIAFHRWSRNYRRTFAADRTEQAEELRRRSEECVRVLIGLEEGSSGAEFDEWKQGAANGVGNIRSIGAFREFVGY